MSHVVGDQLQLYLDGSLPWSERLAADQHLSECAACNEQMVALSRVVAELAAAPELLLPEGFAEKVAQLASDRSNRPANIGRVVVRIALSCLTLGCLLFLLLRREPLPAPDANDFVGTVSFILGSPFDVDPAILAGLSLIAISGSLLTFPLLAHGGHGPRLKTVARPPRGAKS